MIEKKGRGNMGFLWNFIVFSAGYLIGNIIFSFSTMQVLISLRCAMPILRLLKPYSHCFDIVSCRKVFRTAIILNTVITAIAMIATWYFAPKYLEVGIYVGMIVTFLFAFGKCGMTEANVSDTIDVIGRRVYPGKDTELFLGLTQALRSRM